MHIMLGQQLCDGTHKLATKTDLKQVWPAKWAPLVNVSRFELLGRQ